MINNERTLQELINYFTIMKCGKITKDKLLKLVYLIQKKSFFKTNRTPKGNK